MRRRATRRWRARRGTAIAVKSLLPDVRVIGVQAAASAPYAGGTSPAGPVVTLADGIAVKHPGALTAPLVATWVDELAPSTRTPSPMRWSC